jgi:hypothetical protein
LIDLIKRIISKILKKTNFTLYSKLLFKKIHGYNLDLKHPKTFSEKIQWMKLFGELEKNGKYVDKHDVRAYVKNIIGDKYLVPSLGCFSEANDIDFDKLPNRFVIKATHASGWNLVVFDKNKLDIVSTKTRINKWINNSFYKKTGERNYKNVPGRVVIEDFIEDPSGDLMDYRFFCYNGIPKFIQVDSYTEEKKKRNIYDINWDKLDVAIGYENIKRYIEKPEKLTEMLEISSKLSKDIPFVRIDLYYANKHIYFGEMTFTPQNGYGKFTPVKYDYIFGEDFKLPKK